MRGISVSAFLARSFLFSGAVALAFPAVSAAQAAPAAAPAAPADPESFDLAAAMAGPGARMSAADAAKRAAETAPSVVKADAAAHKAEVAAEAANVAVYPRLDLEARYTLVSKVELPAFLTSTPGAGDGFKAQVHQGLFQARLTYPVSTLFFSVLPRYNAAKKQAESAKFQRTVEGLDVGLRTRETYYNYARARAALLVARSALAQADAHHRDVEALVAAGTLARVEVMRANAQTAFAKVNVSRTEGQVAAARAALYSLLHMQGTTQDVAVTENLEEPLPALTEPSDAMVTRAFGQRSELKALRILSDAHDLNVKSLEGEQLPQLNIGGSADLANPNQRYFGGAFEWNTSWAAFASLTWSPNDYASAGKGVDQARADRAQTVADIELLQDGLRVEIAQAYEDYNAARASMEASESGIAAAEESFRVRREQFRAGAAVATDVIDAEAELRQARLDFVNAAIDGRIAKARLDRAVEAQ